MATFGELKGRILRLVGDPEQDAYSDDLLRDAIQAAQLAILPWIPKTATSEFAAGSTEYVLPTGLYAIEAVVVRSTGEMLAAAVFAPGNYRGENISATNDWLEYPAGSVTFSKELDEPYDLYYLAQWTDITENTQDNDALEPPDYCSTGMVLYGGAYVLQPSAVNAAEVRQFNTRVDSGNPEHNPMQDAATYLLKLFTNEMNRHPKHQRAQR